jgi:hypothetical protein
MITWAQKVAFVGMVVETIPADEIGCYQYSSKVRIPDGLCSFGEGDTEEESIENAAIGMNIDWGSVERKITEREWEKMSHT